MEPVPAFDVASETETLQFLLRVAEVANSSLELDELLKRIAEVIRQVVDYEIFAILLLNESTQELRIRYSIGHKPELVRSLRIPVGKGITGGAVAERAPVLVNDVKSDPRYIPALEEVRSELAVPMIAKNRVVGVIDLQCTHGGCFTERHRDVLSLVASRVAIAVENARLYRATLRQAKVLSTLSEISREFSSILQLDELLRKIAELLHRLVGYDAFNILLLDEQAQLLRPYLSIQFREQVEDKNDMPLGTGIVGHAAADRRSLLIPDVTRDPRYVVFSPATRSELAVPLVVKDRVVGVLNLESARRAFFTTRHLQMMEVLGPQIAIAIENARLYEKLSREEARLEHDLRAARELQSSLLPPCCPEIPGMQLCARYEPARELGGDLYDFVEYDAEHGRCTGLGIFTGDVAGKGAPAALYAALSHGLIRTLAQRCRPAGEMLSKLNGVLCERRIQARYLSLCYAFLDTRSWRMEIANAGLPLPIFCRGSEIIPVQVEGVPLGLLENVEYQPAVVELQPGDVAVFHSDGITENLNPEGEEYGRRRLQDLVGSHCTLPAGELVERIFEEADRWSAEREAFDDRTVVVLKIAEKGPCGAAPCR